MSTEPGATPWTTPESESTRTMEELALDQRSCAFDSAVKHARSLPAAPTLLESPTATAKVSGVTVTALHTGNGSAQATQASASPTVSMT